MQPTRRSVCGRSACTVSAQEGGPQANPGSPYPYRLGRSASSGRSAMRPAEDSDAEQSRTAFPTEDRGNESWSGSEGSGKARALIIEKIPTVIRAPQDHSRLFRECRKAAAM